MLPLPPPDRELARSQRPTQRSAYSQLVRNNRPLARVHPTPTPQGGEKGEGKAGDRQTVTLLLHHTHREKLTFSLSRPCLNHDGVLHDILEVHRHAVSSELADSQPN